MIVSRVFDLILADAGALDEPEDAHGRNAIHTPDLKAWFVYGIRFINPDDNAFPADIGVQIRLHMDPTHTGELIYHQVVTSAIPLRTKLLFIKGKASSIDPSTFALEELDYPVDYSTSHTISIEAFDDGDTGSGFAGDTTQFVLYLTNNEEGCSSNSAPPKGFK